MKNIFFILTFFLIVGVLSILLNTYVYNSPDRIFFAVTKFELFHEDGAAGKNPNNRITIGEKSDVYFVDIPQQFIAVWFTDSVFNWEINKDYLQSDSLQYFKINNENPNTHKILPGDTLTINYEGMSYLLDYETLRARTKKQVNKYYAVRNLLNFSNDTLRNLKSLVVVDPNKNSTRDTICVIILDKYTTLYTPTETKKYTEKGSTKKNELKLEFFSVSETQAMHKKTENEQMFVGDVNYYVKPVVRRTGWGAGHVMLRYLKENRKIQVNFPKANVFSEDLLYLEHNLLKPAGGEIVIKQKQAAFSTQNDIYLPIFSAALPIEICQIEKYDGQENIHIRPFNEKNDSCLILKENNLLLPEMDEMVSDYGENTGRVYFKARNLNRGFFLCAYVPLLVVLVLIMVGIWLIFSEVLLKSMGEGEIYSMTKAQNTWKYLIMIVLLFFAFLCCKLFVGTKLSFTYPFFEKIYPVTILGAILQFALLFICLLVVNIRFSTRLLGIPEAGFRKYIPLIVTTIILVFIWGIFIFTKNNLILNFSADAFTSYPAKELGFLDINSGVLDPRKWKDSTGMNENHTTVYHMLTFVLGGMFMVYICSFFCLKFKTTEKWLNKIAVSARSHERLFPIILSCLIAVLVATCFFIPGNFSSMIISPLVIVGLSFAFVVVMKIKRNSPVWSITLKTLAGIISCGVFVFCASLPDHGYITNLVGMLLAFYMVFMLINFNGIVINTGKIDILKNRTLILTAILLCVGYASLMVLLPASFSAEEVKYDRMNRRMSMFLDFNQVHETGYRYNESDSEFMVVMSHYMVKESPKGNEGGGFMSDSYPLHSSISTGQSPVVLNDVSFPAAFYSPLKYSYLVFFGLLAAMVTLIFGFSIHGIQHYEIKSPKLHLRLQWRILAVCMWIGSSLYIYASYLGFMPFTGRLIPGFGVDSVGESIESVMLFAFMGAVAFRLKDI